MTFRWYHFAFVLIILFATESVFFGLSIVPGWRNRSSKGNSSQQEFAFTTTASPASTGQFSNSGLGFSFQFPVGYKVYSETPPMYDCDGDLCHNNPNPLGYVCAFFLSSGSDASPTFSPPAFGYGMALGTRIFIGVTQNGSNISSADEIRSMLSVKPDESAVLREFTTPSGGVGWVLEDTKLNTDYVWISDPWNGNGIAIASSKSDEPILRDLLSAWHFQRPLIPVDPSTIRHQPQCDPT